MKRIFEWYCTPSLAEDLLGDLDEIFYQNLNTMSRRKAKLKYVFQGISLLFSYGVKSRKQNNRPVYPSGGYHSWAMYKSYATIAFRSLARQKAFSIINIICLSVGMSVGLLALGAFIDVMQVDSFQVNKDRIYRVTTNVDDKNEKRTFASSSFPLAEKIEAEAPEVEEVVNLSNSFSAEVTVSPSISIPFRRGYYASENFFKVFSYSLLEGNAASALIKPFSIVLTEESAYKLFRESDPLGKTIEIAGMGNFEVTGVVKDAPRSHFYFEALASYSTIQLLEAQGKISKTLNSWGPVTDHYAYLLLKGDRPGSGLRKVLDESSKYVNALQQNARSVERATFDLQPLTAIPLSETYNDIGLAWGYASLLVFFFLSVLVLLPACFNYANISIARALKRAKEIGLRKVSGGESRHIFLQMVMETIIISLIALAGSMLIFYGVREEFLKMVVDGDKTFSLDITPISFAAFAIFAIVTGLLAGIFPASYFAKLNPIQTLRNSSASGKLSKISIRKGLIVAQFSLSLIFILGVAIIIKQYRYVMNYDFGFQKENILDVPLKGVAGELFKAEVSKLSDVKSVSLSSAVPGTWAVQSTFIRTSEERADSMEVYQMFVDRDYVSNLNIKLLAGSTYPESSSAREPYIMVNEAFLKKIGITSLHEALGMSFVFDDERVRVSGVLKDFNFMPLQEQIYPLAFRHDPKRFAIANIRLTSDDMPRTIASIESVWKKISDQKFEPRFLEHELDDSFTSFNSMIKIFGFLGLLAITISSLGLLAVVISSAESRTREMGIRKVFGATVSNVLLEMSRGFLKLVGIAIIIATPITYFMFDQLFLKMYFYRASIGIGEISLGILFLLALVVMVIGSQTFRVAKINPVETLKYE